MCRWPLAVAGCCLAWLVACNGLIGNEDIVYRTSDAGTRDSAAILEDAAAQNDATVGEAGCGDTQSSTLHCGECGHSCNGAVCSGGLCTPEKLVSPLDNPVGLAVLGGAVFWGEAGSGEFRTCSATPPCNPSQVLPGIAFPQIRNVTRDGTRVYETNARDMRRCVPGQSCAGGSFNLAQTSYAVSGFFANDDLVLITTTVVPNASDADVFIGRGFPLTPAPLALQSQSPTPTAITLAGDVAVWLAADGTRVDRCRIGDMACADNVATLVSGRQGASAVVGTSTHVFWTEGGATGGSVMRCPLDSCPQPTVFASLSAAAGEIKVDGSFVYFASNGIWRCPLSADVCTPRLVATSAGQPRALAFDATSLYWTEPSGLYRVAK